MTLAVTALLGLVSCSTPDPLRPVGLKGHTGPAGIASYAAWPQASHDARRSGSSDSVGPQSSNLRWTRKLEGNVTPGPVIGPGGTIYAATNAGVLHALDPVTGKDLWTFDGGGSYGLDLSTSPAVLPDGTILWPGPGGLYALTSSGALRWKLPLGGQVTSPAVDGDRVVVGTTSGLVAAIDVNRGITRWEAQLGGGSYGSVALSPTDPHRAYQTVDEELVALDDDREAWRAPLDKLVEVSPAVAPDGTIVVGSNAPFERGFSPTGKEIWRYNRQSETYSSPVITDDGIAYFGDHKATVSAVDVATGKLLARYRGPKTPTSDGRSTGVWTSPVVDADHNVYWGSRSGHIIGVDASGNQLFDLETGATVDSYPALGDGLLVVGVSDGRLLGIAA